MNKPEECSVCYDSYDEARRRPRVLPCGHTFCSLCITNTVENANLTCPSCRAHHSVTSTSLFPINFCVQDMIRKTKSIHLTRRIRKKFRSMMHEQKICINSLITDCEEVLSQLGEYRGRLRDWKTRHHQLQDRLVELNTAACQLLEQEDTSVVSYTTQGEEGKKQLETILLCLNTNTVNTDDVDNTSEMVGDWLHKCKQLFPDYNTVHTSMKVQETIMEAVEMMTTETGATAATVHLGETGATAATVHLGETGATAATVHLGETGATAATVHLGETGATAATVHLGETGATAATVHLGETGATAATVHLGDSSITEKVLTITGRFHLEKLNVEDLRRMSEPVKRLVEAGRVLAVQQDQDGRRSARITLQDGQLYLHTLLRQPTPAHAHTLQESVVVGMLDPSCTLAFLDLGWAGSTRGRVIIRLTPDTPRARQFVLLCTGQRGHTYRNTKLLRVWRKGQPGEWVEGGDYESNDGEGGASLLPDLQGQYRRSGRAGAVWAWWPESELGAQFTITTTDHMPRHHYPRVFGEVVSGLDVVRAAVNHTDIVEVTVVDCGVVLPL